MIAYGKLCELGVSHCSSIAESITNSLHHTGFNRTELNGILVASGEEYQDMVTSRDIEKVILNVSKPRSKYGETSPTVHELCCHLRC